MRTRLDLALVGALLLAGGCASNGPYWSRVDRGAAERIEMQERIASLEAQLAAESGRSSALQAQIDALERELARLRARGGSPSSPAPEGLEAPATEPVPQIRAQIEQSDLGAPGELSGELDHAANPPPSPTAPEGESQALYDRSLDFLQQQRLAEAEEGFTRFLAASAGSDLADNAQFWLGECALRRGDVAGALARFRAVVERYPEGNKVPDALLKVGFCLGSLGEPESAATVYRELLLRFPETAAAETARQRLGTQ